MLVAHKIAQCQGVTFIIHRKDLQLKKVRSLINMNEAGGGQAGVNHRHPLRARMHCAGRGATSALSNGNGIFM